MMTGVGWRRPIVISEVGEHTTIFLACIDLDHMYTIVVNLRDSNNYGLASGLFARESVKHGIRNSGTTE